jgi:hypothetical protein
LNKLLMPLASLLSGVGMLVVGTGLLFAAIGAQAGLAKFSGLVTGLIMSAYFAGFVYGTYACPAHRPQASATSGPSPPWPRSLPALPHVCTRCGSTPGSGVLCVLSPACAWSASTSWSRAGSTWWRTTDTARQGVRHAYLVGQHEWPWRIGQWLILVGDRFGFVPFVTGLGILFSFALLPITLTPVG